MISGLIVIVLVITFLLYSLLIGSLYAGYLRIQAFTRNASEPTTAFSIVIPFRNEATQLPTLLHSLHQLQYPKEKFEMLFVDDQSDDGSREIVQTYMEKFPKFHGRVISNQNPGGAPKKAAIALAISQAQHPWIVTTDADVQVSPLWLQTLNDFIQEKKPVLVAAPVVFTAEKNNWLHHLQKQESIILSTVTMGAFGLKQAFMCNGANLAYSKNAFLTVGGFSGNENISSGDDVFILQKIRAHFPERVYFLKSTAAIVTTQTENSWRKLIQQRLRWASKTPAYTGFYPKTLALITACMNLFLLISFFLLPLSPLPGILLVAKIGVDSLMLFPQGKFLKQPISVLGYFFNSLIYPILVGIVVWGTWWGSYSWKGRRF